MSSMINASGPTLRDLGPIRLSEPRLSQRIRVHQAWYRYVVLEEADFGTTRPPTSRPLGSILLPRAAAKFRNLIGPEAIDAYQRRRTLGWGVDPVRTLGYLTSSQALTINLFGALQANRIWCRDVMNLAFSSQPPIQAIHEVEIEYFSRYPSQDLGDRTTVDVLIRGDSRGQPIAIAVETKLGDRFNSREVPLGDAYRAIQHLWKSPADAGRRDVSQLARAHALAEHQSLKAGVGEAPGGRVLLVHHADDATARSIALAYSRIATDATSVQASGIDLFLSLMSRSAPDASSNELVSTLRRRYVDMSESETVWREIQASLGHRSAPRPPKD
jgi:hypothetical protein